MTYGLICESSIISCVGTNLLDSFCTFQIVDTLDKLKGWKKGQVFKLNSKLQKHYRCEKVLCIWELHLMYNYGIDQKI
jgi:hypothetical protein